MSLAPHPQPFSQAEKGEIRTKMNTNEFKMRAARANIQEQTEAEAMLWQLLRNRNFEDLKFRRQHPLKEYIVDFFCYELQLVIELDGGYHQQSEQKEKDQLRDLHLKAIGYKVLRYPNEVLLSGEEQTIFNDILDRKNNFTPKAPLSAGEGLGVRVLSTKKLLPNQRELLLNAGLSFVEYDAITVNRIDFKIPDDLSNAIITSQNAAKALFNSRCQSEPVEDTNNAGGTLRQAQGDNKSYFVVGKKTAALLIEKGLKVIEIAENSAKLAHLIAKNHKNEHFYYFCGNKRRDELPTILKEANVSIDEVIIYETSLNIQSFDQNYDGVLFYSPSGVEAFAKANTLQNTSAFCIGETTADEARKHTDKVIVANDTTVESVIAKSVKTLAISH